MHIARGSRGTVAVGLVLAIVSTATLASAETHSLVVAGERLEFVAQVEKGYVLKLLQRPGGITALSGLSIPDGDDPRPVGGSARRGVWIVESQGRAGRNEATIRSLRTNSQVAYAAPLFSSQGETVAVIPEIVVRVKAGVATAEVQTLCQSAGCTLRKRMEFTQQEYLLEVLGPDAEAVFAAVAQLGQAPEVEWACPNTAFWPKLSGFITSGPSGAEQKVGIASVADDPNAAGVYPNDEYFPRQWHLHNTGQDGGTPGADIRAPEAWEITTGDPNIVVAVVGGGVDTHHPDLINNLVPGYDFFEDDNTPDPGNSGGWEDAHDTMCAGIIAAQGNNGIGVAGVAYSCKIMPIRIFSATDAVTQSDVATAFRWAAMHGADVLSNSWGWSTLPTPIIYSAIVDVTRPDGLGRGGKGCVMVFAAGNEGRPIAAYPARYSEVVAAGAADHDDVLWSFSSYGPALDVVAPSGCDGTWCGQMATFWSTDQTGVGGYSDRNSNPQILDYGEYFGGASVSCPIVAGVAALILSVEPNLTVDEARHFLERSAKDLGDPGRDDRYGWGRVDARAALGMVLAKRCDLNDDWTVDEQDLAILNAAVEANDLSADIAPAARRDGIVDANDRELLMRNLGTVVPELGLIAHWKLDEADGIVAADGAGDHDGALVGDPHWQPSAGKIGGALQLDGTDDYVVSGLVLDPSQGPFSVFAWVKGGAPGQVILADQGANWLAAETSKGALATELKAGGRTGKPLTSSALFTDGVWHRVGLVWDGANRILYLDGAEVARDTQAGLSGSTGNLFIGAGSTLGTGTFWSGLIDDVRIYNRAIKP